MNLQHIDIRPQPGHAPIHRVEDMLPRQPHLIHHPPPILTHLMDPRLRPSVVHAEETFAQDDNLLAGDGVFADRGANDLLGAPVGVHVCCVPGVQADFVGVLEEGEGGGFVEDPFLPVGGAEGHGAQDDFGDFEAGCAEAEAGGGRGKDVSEGVDERMGGFGSG